MTAQWHTRPRPQPDPDPVELDTPANWATDAACLGLDGDLFFPDGKGNAHHTYAEARPVCFTCPVRLRCLDYAIAAGENLGMWGGLTPKERRTVAERRR